MIYTIKLEPVIPGDEMDWDTMPVWEMKPQYDPAFCEQVYSIADEEPMEVPKVVPGDEMDWDTMPVWTGTVPQGVLLREPSKSSS